MSTRSPPLSGPADGRADVLLCRHRLRCLRQRERIFQSSELFRGGDERRPCDSGHPDRCVQRPGERIHRIQHLRRGPQRQQPGIPLRLGRGGHIRLGRGQPVSQLVDSRPVRRESPGAGQPGSGIGLVGGQDGHDYPECSSHGPGEPIGRFQRAGQHGCRVQHVGHRSQRRQPAVPV